MNTTSGKLFKNFTTLFVGLLLVQIINFLFSLVLPKYFSPIQFAQFGIFTSIVFILIELINAKLEVAVMLGKNNEEAKQIVIAAITAAILLSILTTLISIPIIFFMENLYFIAFDCFTIWFASTYFSVFK
ncbi:MAG: hypothetical protein IPF58_14375 [Saprospirales bacterium]|nr:hypothetical protein [Saprospirales bacterium]